VNLRLQTKKFNRGWTQIKYTGKCIAIVDGKVVASGYNSYDVFKRARKKYPDKPTNQIILDYIPKEDFLIL